MIAEIKAKKRFFDKRADFKAFPAFLKPFLEMPKKKTVNLSLKDAVLCLEIFCEKIRFLGRHLFFEYSDALFERYKRKSSVEEKLFVK